jgi:hypothetical protein
MRIFSFLVTTDANTEDEASALWMLRGVAHVQSVENGYLVLLEDGLRDDSDGFGMVAAAVRAFSFVKDVRGFGGYPVTVPAPAFYQPVLEIIGKLQPLEKDHREPAVFAERLREWLSVRKTIHAALFGS